MVGGWVVCRVRAERYLRGNPSPLSAASIVVSENDRVNREFSHWRVAVVRSRPAWDRRPGNYVSEIFRPAPKQLLKG